MLRGTVSDDSSHTALQSASLTLQRLDGRVVARATTNAEGAYEIAAPTAGLYRLSVAFLGYSVFTSQPIQIDSVNVFHALVHRQPIEIPEILISATNGCRGKSATDSLTNAIKLEIVRSLEVIRWTMEHGAIEYTIRDYNQRKSVWGAKPYALPLHESMGSTIAGGNPFTSPPIDSVMKNGFVRRYKGFKYEYVSPDIAILLSPQFQDSHCYRIVTRKQDPSIIGLAFDPKKDTKVVDVYGVVWLKRSNLELTYLDFRYTHLPYFGDNEQTCGRVDFRKLPNGMAFVSEWWVRAPWNTDSRTELMEQRGRIVMTASDQNGQVFERSSLPAARQSFSGRGAGAYDMPGAGPPFVCDPIPK
jgi:hypothetical protein